MQVMWSFSPFWGPGGQCRPLLMMFCRLMSPVHPGQASTQSAGLLLLATSIWHFIWWAIRQMIMLYKGSQTGTTEVLDATHSSTDLDGQTQHGSQVPYLLSYDLSLLCTMATFPVSGAGYSLKLTVGPQ